MIVIASKTEIRMRDDLSKCVKSRPNQRCFLLEFSRTDLDKEELFETFVRLLEDVPDSYMARVYLCRDKDILIMMEGFMQRQFLDFVKKLAHELKREDFTDLIDILELGTHWVRLENFFTDKIEAINNATAQKIESERKEIAELRTMEVMLEIDPSLVSSIEERRRKRHRSLVMVADDDQLSRTLAGNVLRDQYDPVFAKNGSEALKEYVASAPDILFLDIGMPDIGGHEVLESLFQIDPDAYIIMFSGRKDKTTIMASLQQGAQGFLGKPFTRDQLYMHVGNSPYVQTKRGSAA